MADILHMVTVKAMPPRVYAALTQRRGLAGWWTEKASAKAKVGSVARFRFDGGRGNDMLILALKPNRLVKWRCTANSFGEEWVNTELSFELERAGGATVVRFSHRRWAMESDMLRFCSQKWAVFLQSLKGFVETGTGAPWPRDTET